MRFFSFPFIIAILIVGCVPGDKDTDRWQLSGFVKQDQINPILKPDTTSFFSDPIIGDTVFWEGKDVFNPASIVRNDTLFLLYRAEDFIGKYNGTSRIGLAYSLNGLDFIRSGTPVFYPDQDSNKIYEWEGGVEDPRIVEDQEGRYIMTYTGYDGDKARLLVATSEDLRQWKKWGPAFTKDEDVDRWSKSGAIVTQRLGSSMVAQKINNKYWMYFGDTDLFLATSDDLIRWHPLLDGTGNWLPVLSPREGKFDSDLVEPGPPALTTEAGILLIYNSRNKKEQGDDKLPDGTYSAGQVLFSLSNPAKVEVRADTYFFTPEKDYEKTGQINNVCFVEGLSFYKGKWFLYYGTADSMIAVAVSESEIN